MCVMDDDISLDDLSDLTGVERRTLRSWVADGLLSAPLKVGRGALYPRANVDRAMAFAMAYPAALSALQFLIHWPALDQAAQLVQQRFTELDGNHYEILTPAAEALSVSTPWPPRWRCVR